METWPDEAPAQVSAARKLLPTIGKDPEALSVCFARKLNFGQTTKEIIQPFQAAADLLVDWFFGTPTSQGNKKSRHQYSESFVA